jgi:hypothetical protein
VLRSGRISARLFTVAKLASASGRRAATRLGRVRAAVGRLTRLVVRLLPSAGRGGLPRPVTDYKAPNYWLDYRAGFVRRGLPGEVLRRVAAGSPTYRQMERTALGLSRASAMSIVPMALEASLRAPGRLPRVVASGLLLSSPLTCTLLLHDVGRYDAIGVLVLALLSTARAAWLALPLPVSAVLLAGAVSVAVASEEFLLAVLAPTALAAVSRLSRRHQLSPVAGSWLLGGVLGPGALLAGASLLTPAPRDALVAAREEAAQAGVEPPGAMGDALSALDRGYVENLAFFRLFRPAAVGLSCGLWAGFYFVTAGILGKVLGVKAGGQYRLVVAAHALVATALSTAGADFRRWWGLALMGVVSTLVLLEPPAPPQPVTVTALAAAVALGLAGIAPRDMRVHPWGPVQVDRVLPVTM